MGVIIRETPQQRYTTTATTTRHYTVTLIDNDGDAVHTVTTTVTTHPGVVRNWVHSTLHSHRRNRYRLVVGLGVQWTPYDHHYIHHTAATLQLCIGRRCLIFHLHHSHSCPRVLRRLLLDPRVTFVGLWNSLDANMLEDSPHRLDVARGMPVDLRRHAEGHGGRSLLQSSIAEIAEEVLGVDIERIEVVVRSDWEVERLSVEQVKHAAVDAFVAFALGMRLRAWELHPYL